MIHLRGFGIIKYRDISIRHLSKQNSFVGTLRPLEAMEATTTTMMKHRMLFLLIILAAFVPSHARRRKNFKGTERSIRIVNQSGVKIDAFWIHSQTRETTESQTEGLGIVYGADTGISSFAGHSFEVQELPNKKTRKCRRKMCRKAYFTVNQNEEQWYTITPDFFVELEDHTTRALIKAKEALSACVADPTLSPADQLDQMTVCLEKTIDATLEKTREEIKFQAGTSRDMGDLLVHYACRDTSLNTTVTVHNRTWTYHDRISGTGFGTDNKKKRKPSKSMHRMKVLFDSDHSSIQLVENMVTPEECSFIQEASTPSDKDDPNKRTLSLGAYADAPEVKSVLAKIESLMSSAVDIPVSYSGKGPVLEVYMKSGATKTESEQQCTVDTEGDVTCDEVDSDATEAITVTKVQDDVVATLMIFCSAPEKGGAVHFSRTGVHVNPVEGEALLMVYIDTETGDRDQNAFISEYVACPVLEGSMMAVVDNFSDP